MKKLAATVIPLLLLAACSAPREPAEQIAAPPLRSEDWCERHAGTSPDGFDGGRLPYYDRDGAPYFAGPRMTFRDPYFTPDDPLREDSIRRCLREGEQPG